MSDTAFVYCLVDDTGAPVYVGQTQYDVSERAYNHWVCRNSASMEKNNPELAAWLRTLPAPPSYVVLAQVRPEERRSVEAHYIVGFLWAGVRLLNRDQGKLKDEPVGLLPAPHIRSAYTAITWRGVTMTAKDWYTMLGIPPGTFYRRIKRWSLRKTLSTGVDQAVLDQIGEDDGDPVFLK